MPPVDPIESYEDLSSCCYDGPYKQPEIKTSGHFLERVPIEIVCEIINNLPGKDLKNVAVCCRALDEIVTPILYKRSTMRALIAIKDKLPEDYARNVFLNQEKNKEVDKEFYDFLATLPTGRRAGLVKNLNFPGIDSRTWQFGHEFLRRLPGLESINLSWLAYYQSCHDFYFPQLLSGSAQGSAQEPEDDNGVQLDSDEQRADRLITEFGETTMKNITQTSFYWSSMEASVKVLSHLPKLEGLCIGIKDPQVLDKDSEKIFPAISLYVGPTLTMLSLCRQPAMRHIDTFIQPLGDRSKFPSLRIFNINYLPLTRHIRDLWAERATFLYETCMASERHGKWKFPYKYLHLSAFEMSTLEAEQIKTLYPWLRSNIPTWTGEIMLESIHFLKPAEALALEDFLDKMDKIANDIPLKLSIDSFYLPNQSHYLDTIMSFAPRVAELTVTASELLPDNVHGAVTGWCDFLETFIPLCTNMHTLRAIPVPGRGSPNILLMGDLDSKISKLCREHKLRHLDIGLSSIQLGCDLEAIEGPAYTSTQRGMRQLDFRSYTNLKTLRVENLFIFGQPKIWFMDLTAELKSLELIEIHGLVWYTGDESELNDKIPSIEVVDGQIKSLKLVTRPDADSSLLREDPDGSKSEEDKSSGKGLGEPGDDCDDFGTDSRFTEDVNEELRVARLKGWICKVLVETAKKTGGSCRNVVIENLIVNRK